ncbi:hypothetical protein [Aerococcus sp. L_32]|uniref:hypothetical protein n=1 Tax=Aerococcus sp. L_32 TaxID=3422316 RepID=UPI003D6A852A
MGDFVGAIGNSPGPTIPEELDNKVVIRATYALTEHEAFLFTMALQGIVIQMRKENFNLPNLRKVFVLCTKNGEFTFIDNDGMGYYMPFIILNLGNWRSGVWSDLHILAAFIEEFCHHFWSIEDEEIVKRKVIDILNVILKEDITFEKLYGPKWKLAYPTIYTDDVE